MRRSRLAGDEPCQTEYDETRRDATLAFEPGQALFEPGDLIRRHGDSNGLSAAHWRTSSTRRLRARPDKVSFVAFGREAPKPAVVSRDAGTR
jgi:hypothetical protein